VKHRTVMQHSTAGRQHLNKIYAFFNEMGRGIARRYYGGLFTWLVNNRTNRSLEFEVCVLRVLLGSRCLSPVDVPQ